MEPVRVTIQEFKEKLIEVGRNNGLPEEVIQKLNVVYEYQMKKFTNNLPYKANEIIESYVTQSNINIKVFLINVLIENTQDSDKWAEPVKEVIETYRVA